VRPSRGIVVCLIVMLSMVMLSVFISR
jgi:hypothetical protein